MIEQLKTIRAGLETATCYSMLGVDAHSVQIALTALTQLEAMVGAQEPVGEVVQAFADLTAISWKYNGGKFPPVNTKLYAAPVAQQPQEIEVQCPVCNHKFYEWPNDKQPQAEAVPAVDRVYEAAKRLVDHADFQLGGVLSAKSKARDIPSNAASKVKARHLASLRDALAKTPQQAEAVPSDVVRDAERLDWLLMQVSGKEFRRIGVEYSGNCNRAAIDAAMAQGANHE